jgi:flagellar biosynthetic protein FlhB
MADTVQERTERATPRKIRKAREEGQVARSAELNSVIIISFGFLTIFLLGPMLCRKLAALMQQTLHEAPLTALSPTGFQLLVSEQMLTYAVIVGPILLSLAVFGYLINVSQTGFLFSPKAIAPKFDRFNIANGFKRLISKRSLVELFRDVIKIILITIVTYYAIAGWMPELMRLGDASVGQIGGTLGKLVLTLAIKISVVLLIVALFDFAFHRYEYAANLRMTRQELREEMKETEGDPLLKARIRQIQREAARRRMMAEIPKADVVITNPTTLAVALRYRPDEMPAPMVLAKGQRLMADKIKEIAREHAIPIVENRPLARSLFTLVDAGEYIPATLYRAVAEVLAYIYRLKEPGGTDRG